MKSLSISAMAFAMLAFSACSDDQHDVTSYANKKPQEVLYFVPLTFSAAVAEQGYIIRLMKQQLPDKDHRYWQATAFTMPNYAQMTNLTDQFIDTNAHPQLQAGNSDEFILYIPAPHLSVDIQPAAVWLWIKACTATLVQSSVNKRWLPILLTPDIAKVIEADKKRRSKLAEKLADKAYFFGYATNEDALE